MQSVRTPRCSPGTAAVHRLGMQRAGGICRGTVSWCLGISLCHMLDKIGASVHVLHHTCAEDVEPVVVAVKSTPTAHVLI